MESFAETGLLEPILEAVKELGFEKPTPIQAKTIPHLLNTDRDLIAFAQTVLMALQTFLEAPAVVAALGWAPLPLLLAGGLAVLACMACGSTVLVVLAGAYAGRVPRDDAVANLGHLAGAF